MRINILIPITGLSEAAIKERLEYIRGIAEPGTEIEAYQVEEGPAAIESQVDSLMAVPHILKLVKKAEAEGFDATIIWCGGDPALEAARELVNIPVIGPGESMKLLASMLGKKPFRVTPNIPVLEMRRDLDVTKKIIRTIVEEKIEKGEGDTFYLGCLALWGVGKALRAETGIPIIDGAEASLKMAEVSVKLGLMHSRAAYPKYPPPHRKSSPVI